MNKVETKNYRRISKAKARKLYDMGIDILVVPCKLSPENPWGIGVTTNGHYWNGAEFDRFLNEFIWYNCQNTEWGKYPAFYEIKEH